GPQTLVTSFETFIGEHKDEITALQVLYSKPYGRRLTFEDIKLLAETIQAPPRQWTAERLWQAYETLFASRVRGAPGRVLTNLVSLVRFALSHEALVPYPDVVVERYATWLAQQEQRGRKFTPEQRQWLEAMRDHVAANLSGYRAKHISQGTRSITAAGLANSSARLLPAGAVLMSSRAPVGYAAIAAQPMATNQGFKSFVLHAELVPDFFYYFLLGNKE